MFGISHRKSCKGCIFRAFRFLASFYTDNERWQPPIQAPRSCQLSPLIGSIIAQYVFSRWFRLFYESLPVLLDGEVLCSARSGNLYPQADRS